MTKKIISLLLALTLCVGLCTVITSAAGTTHEVSDEAELAAALTGAVDGDTISMKNDITWTSSSKARIGANIIFEGNNHTLTFTNSKYGLRMETDAASGTTIQNVKIVSKVAAGRCINIYADGIDNITITDCELDTTACPSGYIQPLTIGGTEADGYTTVVKVLNTTIKAGNSGYSIISYLVVDLLIENCEIEGWNALYLKDGSDNSYVQISDSEIETVNVHSGETNAFSAIAVESSGNTIDVYSSTFKCTSEGDQPQSVIGLGSENDADTHNNEIFIQPDCEIETETILNVQDSDMLQGDNSIAVPAEYAEKLSENGYVVVVEGGYAVPAITKNDFQAVAPEHNPKEVKSEAPACAENGFETYYVCNEDCCWGLVFTSAEGDICIGDISEYTPAPAAHTLKKVEATKATAEKEGNKEHYACEVCGGLFEDAEGTKATTKAAVTIAKNPPTSDIPVFFFASIMLVSAAAAVTTAKAKDRV